MELVKMKETILPKPPTDEQYELYEASVQDTETDVETLSDIYKEIRGKKPLTLREDFCGTFKLCTDWVQSHKKREAWGIDLDPTPLDYGRRKHLAKLKPAEQARVHLSQDNVLKPTSPQTDMLVAFNFSYFIFKKREEMKKYFRRCAQTLNDDGLFFLDHMGGTGLMETSTDKEKFTKGKKPWFTYYWKQKSFDPIGNNAYFTISFKKEGEKKQKDVFHYDWRLWALPELKDILIESGFKNVYFYFEGEDEDGDGNGIFTRREVEEEHEVWIAYIVASKN